MKYQSFKYLLSLVLAISVVATLEAQHLSNNGKFEVNALQGCVSTTDPINISYNTINPCPACDFCADINGTPICNPPSNTFTFTEPGTYRIEYYETAGTITDYLDIVVHKDTIPEFNIYRCGDRNVEVRINDDNYDSYLIDWGDGNTTTVTPPDVDALYGYGSSGNKNVTVTGLYENGAGNCTPNEQTVTDIDNLPIATINSISPVENQTDKVVIKYTADPNALYKLQLSVNGDGNFVPVQDLPMERDSIVISSLLLENNYYCFRIATLNACVSGNPPADYSTEVCTQVFNVNFTGNEENILNWTTTSTSATGYTVQKNSSTLGPFNDPSRRNLSDNDVLCNENYCYTLVTNYPSGATATSLERCGTAKLNTTPPPIDNVTTQVNDSEIDISWEGPSNTTVDFYNLFRSVNDGFYDVATNELENTQLTDTGLDPVVNSYCYQINYKDHCGNDSEVSEDFCVIHLRGNPSSTNVIKLNWNVYEGYSSGVSHYILEKLSSTGSPLGTFVLPGTSYIDTLDMDDPQEIRYRVTAVPNDGTYEESVSNILSIIRQGRFTAPNAFIPNGSEENRVFRIVSPFVAEIDLRIFNRWGTLVYQTTNNETGWPGTDQNGNPLPQGTYVYQIKMVSEAGEESHAYGTVMLLRN